MRKEKRKADFLIIIPPENRQSLTVVQAACSEQKSHVQVPALDPNPGLVIRHEDLVGR
jgi:hypothetical protein